MRTIQDGLRANDRMNAVIEDVKRSEGAMTAAVGRLVEANRAIQGIADDLGGIALKAKLLSVNAAIEVAHAGSDARTFDVVAQEIRAIAETCDASSRQTLALTQEANRVNDEAVRIVRDIEQQLQDVMRQQEIVAEVLVGVSTRGAAADAEEVPEEELLRFDPATMGTGVESVDAQHRTLIDMLNALHRACLEGHGKEQMTTMLDFMGAYAVEHFSHEEQVMAERRCPAAGRNREAHQQLLATYQQWRQRYDAEGAVLSLVMELRDILHKWLVGHICKVDCELRSTHAARRAA